jgi:hypothetical protein
MIFRESQGSDVFLDSYHNFYNKHMEFTDIVITDKKKNSVIFHLPGKYFKELNKRLTDKGFELTFKKAISKGQYTCSYTLKKKK